MSTIPLEASHSGDNPPPSWLWPNQDLQSKKDKDERLDAYTIELNNLFEDGLGTLRKLHQGDFLSASGDTNYKDRFFGRDTAIVVRSLVKCLEYRPDDPLSAEIHEWIQKDLVSLAYFQGSRDTVGITTSEERGKYHHEAFAKDKDPKLASLFNNPDDESLNFTVSYVSADSSPQAIVAATEYGALLKEQGEDPDAIRAFLSAKRQNYRPEIKLSLAESLVAAGDFLLRKIKESDIGLVEFERKTGQEEAPPIQVLEDSITGMIHLDGQLANTAAPIASIDVQALTHDAFLGLADMFEADPELAQQTSVDGLQIEQWRQAAGQLRQRTIDLCWIPGDNRFAQAIDRDPRSGGPRWVATPSAKELRVLDSGLFDGLVEPQKELFVGSLIKQAESNGFLTEVGFATRDRRLRGIVPFTDYHGESTVWPAISNIITRGLERQGFYISAQQGDIRDLNNLVLNGGAVEYTLLDSVSGKPFLHTEYLNGIPTIGRRRLIVSTNIREEDQAWSAAAEAEAASRLMATSQAPPRSQPEWVARLEQATLAGIEPQELIINPQDIQEKRARSLIAVIGQTAGRQADAKYHELETETRRLHGRRA